MNPTYLFYDLETTGLNKCFDQVLQFAAIRTDLHLQEIERHQFQVRLNNDVIPAPAAMITHRLGIAQCHKGEKEYDAIQKIHALLNTAGTISLGYNTLSFDDEFLRFSFHRNLLTPYTHQYANGCSRMDIYPLAIVYHLFKSDILQWPIINGRTSLKLENLNAANHWVDGAAHDALVDVEATIELAKTLYQEKSMWNYLIGYFDKKIDPQRMRKLSVALTCQDQPLYQALALEGKMGSRHAYMSPVLYLGQHKIYRNQTLWLRLDTEELQKTTTETIDEKTWGIRKKTAEPPFLLPMIDRYSHTISKKRLALTRENLNWLAQIVEVFFVLVC